MIFVIPDGIGDADTDIPHLRFLGTSHPTAECPPFLRMLDLRHIRLLTAQVEEQLQHGGKGLPVFLPTANVSPGIRDSGRAFLVFGAFGTSIR